MKYISPTRFFTFVALLFGMVYSLVLPPFQVPDEFNHFYRAWQITEGELTAVRTSDNRVGGELPQSLNLISEHYRTLPFQFQNKTSIDSLKKLLKTPLNANKIQFFDFANTGLYAPTAYLPQALVIFILKKFDCSPLSIFYISRLATLLTWLLIIIFALKTTPVAHWLFVFMALLPSSLFINSGINADVISNALSFLLIAFILKWLVKNEPVSRKDLMIWVVSSLILSVNKIVYFPLIFLILLVKKENFKHFKSKIFVFSLVILSNFTGIIEWILITRPLQITYDDYNPIYRTILPQPLNEGVNHAVQLDFILHHPFQYTKILCFSFLKSAPHTLIHYLGKFGWEKNYFPLGINVMLFFILILRGVSDGIFFNQKKRDLLVKFSFTAISILMGIGVATFLYMNSCAIGGDFIFNLSGKYFIPIFPLLFLSISSISLKKTLNLVKIGHFLMSLVFQQAVLIFSLVYGIFAVIERYYVVVN